MSGGNCYEELVPETSGPRVNCTFDVILVGVVKAAKLNEAYSTDSPLVDQEIREQRKTDLFCSAMPGPNRDLSDELHLGTEQLTQVVAPVSRALTPFADGTAVPKLWKRILHAAAMTGIGYVSFTCMKVLLNLRLFAYS